MASRQETRFQVKAEYGGYLAHFPYVRSNEGFALSSDIALW